MARPEPHSRGGSAAAHSDPGRVDPYSVGRRDEEALGDLRAGCDPAFFRTTTRPVDVAGIKLGEGGKVLLFLAAANRDARRWEDPDRFDITRRATGHLAFGVGIHGCVGMAVARLEAEIVLTLLARKVEAIEISGEPERRLNNTLRGLARLPIAVCAA